MRRDTMESFGKCSHIFYCMLLFRLCLSYFQIKHFCLSRTMSHLLVYFYFKTEERKWIEREKKRNGWTKRETKLLSNFSIMQVKDCQTIYARKAQDTPNSMFIKFFNIQPLLAVGEANDGKEKKRKEKKK